MKRTIEINGEKIDYHYERKNTVRAYIRINKEAEIKVTIPKNCSFAVIDDFIKRKFDWIQQKIQERQTTPESSQQIAGQDSEWTLFKGNKYPINITLSKKVLIKVQNGVLEMQLTLPKERINIPATIDGWRKFTAKYVYQEILTELFERIKPYGYKMPLLRVKKMSSRWGSYSRRTHAINLNSELLKAPIECIEFVIMHELCHLKHLDHSKNFYGLFTSLMPDHREREKKLKHFHREYGF